ncbi:hypothetical protein VNO80_16772 [Phaseolus coccineus]|uniref:Uncharacterized protein n=1 Tax=Phaseolus coccineus TaxID=3886 RepID=A0AAN9R4A8_PHACN
MAPLPNYLRHVNRVNIVTYRLINKINFSLSNYFSLSFFTGYQNIPQPFRGEQSQLPYEPLTATVKIVELPIGQLSKKKCWTIRCQYYSVIGLIKVKQINIPKHVIDSHNKTIVNRKYGKENRL